MATLDLLALPEGYDAVNDVEGSESGTGSNDERIARLITAVSLRIDDKCGPVVQRTVTGEEHAGGDCRIYLRYRPVASITTLTEYNGTSGQVLAAEAFPDGVTAFDYKLLDDGDAGVVERRSTGYARPFAFTRVIATYKAGRFADTDSVDGKFKAAASAILRRLWSRESGRWAAGGDPFEGDVGATGIGFFRAVDPMIAEFLGDELLLKDYA